MLKKRAFFLFGFCPLFGKAIVSWFFMSKGNCCCGSIIQESNAESRDRKLIIVESSIFLSVKNKLRQIKVASNSSQICYSYKMYHSIQKSDLFLSTVISLCEGIDIP